MSANTSQATQRPTDAMGILTFCQRNAISRSLFYKMSLAGTGPRILKAGCKVLITEEAAAEWRRKCEVAA